MKLDFHLHCSIVMSTLWNKLNGYKTGIGVLLHVTWFLLNLIFKELSTDPETLTGHGLIFTMTGVGIGHKVYKNKTNIVNAIKYMNTESKK